MSSLALLFANANRKPSGAVILLFSSEIVLEAHMLAQGKLVGFVPTTDGAKAREFYENKLGLEFVSDDGFALVMRSGTSTVRIVKMKQVNPAQYTVLGWEVADIASVVSQLKARGVEFERYPFIQDQESGIWTAPGGAQVAWFKDADGNVLSVSQH
jgi:catechol 2,3-dioxygenase-like lactoylglutathione lyase family enzyme